MDLFTKPGATLPNGAVVIASRPAGAQHYVVLALTMGQSAHPYVTWVVGEETGHATAGDYCLTFEGAIRSYAARSGFAVETLGHGTVPPEDKAKDVTPRLRCDTCPFESADPDAIRGHEAGPSSGRGWLGEGETHRMHHA